ncbi:MAG: alanine--glyoxylate aminotransferase family protein [Proteobacteria bacterium]|nr:alanine--glyoxylate aminotransferase family protein [Pseudomonadota bacterium]NCA27654.1 alanine--glyoxylate aminotransferase family protein [Pseudomonadota bacterium]
MKKPISFLSGPVMISPKVSKAFSQDAISHRSSEFSKLVDEVQSKLKILTKAKYSTLMMGSGSLANEVIAANLSTLKNEVGLIISNGEFGERLINQATRHNLNFHSLKKNWGEVFDYHEIAEILLKKKIDWIWFVHCETSTGMMNDLEQILEITEKTNVKVCVDCVSSIGVYQIDLSKVYLASASSNKGLESFAGIAIVLHNHQPEPQNSIAQYLDIGFYQAKNNIPFTFSSNLLKALNASLELILQKDKTPKIQKLNDDLVKFLGQQKIKIVASEKVKSCAITTIEFDQSQQSEKLGQFLESQGILVHYQNSYLKERNWLQIAFFSSSIKVSDLEKLKNILLKFRNLNNQ